MDIDLGLRFFRSFCGSSLSKRCAWLMGPGAHMSCRQQAETTRLQMRIQHERHNDNTVADRICGEGPLTADFSAAPIEKQADLDAVHPLAPDIPLPFVHLGSKRKQKELSWTEQLQRRSAKVPPRHPKHIDKIPALSISSILRGLVLDVGPLQSLRRHWLRSFVSYLDTRSNLGDLHNGLQVPQS